MYSQVEKSFRQVISQARQRPAAEKKAAVVVDLFGGIGATVVCLKRMGIAIQKVIHVEHDKVANYVYRYWHDRKTKDGEDDDKNDDGIHNIYISRFEEFEQNLDSLLKEHGRKFTGRLLERRKE